MGKRSILKQILKPHSGILHRFWCNIIVYRAEEFTENRFIGYLVIISICLQYLSIFGNIFFIEGISIYPADSGISFFRMVYMVFSFLLPLDVTETEQEFFNFFTFLLLIIVFLIHLFVAISVLLRLCHIRLTEYSTPFAAYLTYFYPTLTHKDIELYLLARSNFKT